ncbi:MAG TPA: hypothetical protein VFW95_01535 [Candidatus Limnocylindria bacterium]|nr:hypothetical protein [Candidatus Limnocylindria bacterium]
MRIARGIALLLVVALLLFAPASRTSAVQTFPDPFDGAGTFVDLRAGSTGQDIGDVFMLREGTTFRVRIFLDAPSVFIDSHLCVSADPFTVRIPPGQCQFAAAGAASGTYDVVLPPSTFPPGTVPFSDGLGPFCAQIHVAYNRPGLARTALGGGSAYAGWEPGSPFFGNVCFPAVPDPAPDDPQITVAKTGSFSGGVISFTVTVENPTTTEALNVALWETLPLQLTWTVPPECVITVIDAIARCDLGNLAGGASVPLTFSATPAANQCGTFDNFAEAFIDGTPSANDTAAVEVPCPPEPADPVILMTKVASSATASPPGTIVYLVTVENVGPGNATDVTLTDELPEGPTWSLGSGSNLCSISGTTLTCFAPDVPDGVFEVLQIFGAVDESFCGTLENSATITWSGGPATGSATASAGEVEVLCPPSPAPTPDQGVGPDTGGGDEGGGGGGGELPDTRTDAAAPVAPDWPISVATLLALAVALVADGRRVRRH